MSRASTSYPLPWAKKVTRWFFQGASADEISALVAKPGVDKGHAMRAVKACLGSFDPKHEHKTAGVAFMLSEWFETDTK